MEKPKRTTERGAMGVGDNIMAVRSRNDCPVNDDLAPSCFVVVVFCLFVCLLLLLLLLCCCCCCCCCCCFWGGCFIIDFSHLRYLRIVV